MLYSLPFVGMNGVAMIGTETLLIVGGVVVLLFGGRKIPELFRGLGQGMGEFQRGIEDAKRTIHTPAEEKREDE